MIEHRNNAMWVRGFARVVGYARDIAIALRLGVGMYSDVLILFFRLLGFSYSLFFEGVMRHSFIPQFVQSLKKRNSTSSLQFAGEVLYSLMVAIAILAIVIIFFMDSAIYLLAPGFSATTEYFSSAIYISRLAVVYFCINSCALFCANVMDIKERWVTIASLGMILDAILIAVAIVEKEVPNIVWTLAYGAIIASVLQCVWMIILLCYKNATQILNSIMNKWGAAPWLLSKNVQEVFLRIPAGLSIASLYQANLWASTFIASFTIGGLSYLYYGYRIMQIPLLMVMGLSSAFIMSMSKLYLEKRANIKIFALQSRMFQFVLFLTIPAACILCALSRQTVLLLFERGEFTADNTANVAMVLQIISITLPACVLNKILSLIFWGNDDNKRPMYISVAAATLNVTISSAMLRSLDYVALAFGFAIATWIHTITLFCYGIRKDYIIFPKILFVEICKYLISSCIMLVTLYHMTSFHYESNAVELTIKTSSCVAAYLLACIMMRVKVSNSA